MNIAIRVDASLGIGSGHVFRCINIARELKLLGHNIIFFMRDNPHSLIDKVIGEGFRVIQIPVDDSDSRKGPFELNPSYDAAFLAQVSSQLLIDWIVVDHYGADSSWENIVKSEFPIMAIDDYCEREHVAQIVLNPNFLSQDHAKLLMEHSGSSHTISGINFIPLRSHSQFPAEIQPQRAGGDLSIYFGASDPFGLTTRVLRVLVESLSFQNTIHVIVGINSDQTEEIASIAQLHSNVQVHKFTDDLGSIFSIAEISIGAGGSTIWERLLYRNKCLVIGVAENQIALSECLSEVGAIKFAGLTPNLTDENLLQLIQEFLANWVTRHNSDESLLIDRLGSARIASLITIAAGDLDSFRLILQSPATTVSAQWITFDLYWRNLYVSKVEVQNGETGIEFSLENNDFSDAIENAAQIQLTPIVHRNLQQVYPHSYFGIKTKQKLKVLFLVSQTSWVHGVIWDHLGTLLREGIFVKVSHEISAHEESDICILLGFEQLLQTNQLSSFRNILVVHESDLPRGRGWSPMTWRVLEGNKEMHLTLFEAETNVDSGVIYGKRKILLSGSEVVSELRAIQMSESFALIGEFLTDYPSSLDSSEVQVGEPTYFKRRTKSDSQCVSGSTIDSIFDLLRVSDPDRYPVYFEKNGGLFKLTMDRIDSRQSFNPTKGKM